MTFTEFHELTEDNASMSDLLRMLAQQHLRLMRLEVIAMDLVVALTDTVPDRVEGDAIAARFAKFMGEVTEESKLQHEATLAITFLNSPE